MSEQTAGSPEPAPASTESAASSGAAAEDERESKGGSSKGSGTRRPFGPKTALWAFLHLAALSTFALAQPLFDLLGKNPEFFAARGSTPSEVIVFALGVVLMPPIAFLLVELLASLAGAHVRQAVHLALLALLTAVILVQALKESLGGSDVVLIAVASGIGGVAAALYARAEPVRSFVSVLSPAPVVFLVLFLVISPVSKIAFPDDAGAQAAGGIKRVPVVMVVFDEFPTGSLLGADQTVDAKRYPGFARLAKDATWFRNAHSIYDSTSKAVPAIMDGNYPEKGTLPTASDHPDSLFSLLGESHRMNVSEEATTVCSRDLCSDDRLDEPFGERLASMTEDLSLVYAHLVSPPGIESDLPTISETWGDFGGGGGAPGGADVPEADRETPASGKQRTLGNLRGGRSRRFSEWLDRIPAAGGRPTLSFKHILLPHVPWQYLPDGRLYRSTAAEPITGISRQSYPDQGAVDQLQLRHLLQVGFADLQLRRLIARLKDQGIYDDALIVVTADHGVSFLKGQFDRRRLDSENFSEISPIPLFIKRPGQTRGGVDDANVETTDILPTIAELLGAQLPSATDGRSAFSAAVQRRSEVKMLERDLSGWIRISPRELARQRQERLANKVRLFGEGKNGPGRIYRFGPNRQLIGRPVSELDTGGSSRARVRLADADGLRDVDPASAVVPTWITGRVSGPDRRDLAIAVNGTVRAVANSFELATGGGQIFGALVPASALRAGANAVDVYEVDGSQLRRMGGTG